MNDGAAAFQRLSIDSRLFNFQMMGKPFRSELMKVPGSLAWSAEADIGPLVHFLECARGHLLVAIGAGGSYSSAEFLRLLHESRGGAAIAHTPLSFLQSKTDLTRAYVVIYTASGNNRDVLATYEAAAGREPRGVLVVCGNRKSKIEDRVAGAERTTLFAKSLPTGRDGFLATNSLAVFCALTLRAFGVKIGEAVSRLKTPKLPPPALLHHVVLYADWARPAAVDLESKFSEAALGGVMLVDYRHFAHGRHNWIDKRKAETVVIAFVTPESRELARKTRALLPAGLPVAEISTELEGPVGGLELLLSTFELTALVGERVGIDPGRPGVPRYGRQIYHLGPMSRIARRALPEHPAIARKQAARGTLGDERDLAVIDSARRDFCRRLARTCFGVLVMDFDGTAMSPGAGRESTLALPVRRFFERLLRNGVGLCFATGRGDSVHSIIATSIASRFHPVVFVSYYNGSVTRCLADPPPTPADGPHQDEFADLRERLLADAFLRELASPENKGFQLTLKARSGVNFGLVCTAVRERLALPAFHGFRMVESSHSLDVVPAEASKLNVVQMAQARLPAGREVLTLGDRGAIGGNDHELLSHPFSLSVDLVSSALDSCWNLLPPGCRNVAGLLHYAGWTRVVRGGFTLRLPREVTR